MALIELRDVSRSYLLGETRVEALKSINLNIDSGEFTALWGPSGSGKSSLCHLIGAIDRPDSGTVSINGKDLKTLSDDALSSHRNRSVGFIFQSFNLVNVLSALENVLLPLQLRGSFGKRDSEQARELLTELGLGKHLTHRPDKLSGGQRQRVAIARALITEAPIIVADEPTANLDSVNAEQILESMRGFNRDRGTTFVFATHDPRLLEQANRRIQLCDGTIEEDLSRA